MTASATDLALYTLAIFVLFLTPGPVWVALTARALSGGYAAAWPLAFGVVVGDALWPLLAVLGVSWILSVWGVFLVMGALVIRHADKTIASDSRLTRPGQWAGFVAGVAVILGNPKAILFYMGVLPGFFDLASVTPLDVTAIMAVSMAVPLLGNLALALLVGRVRGLLTSPKALRRTNLTSGVLLLLVGLVIPFPRHLATEPRHHQILCLARDKPARNPYKMRNKTKDTLNGGTPVRAQRLRRRFHQSSQRPGGGSKTSGHVHR